MATQKLSLRGADLDLLCGSLRFFFFLEKERSTLVCCWGNMDGEEKMNRSLGIFSLSKAFHWSLLYLVT